MTTTRETCMIDICRMQARLSKCKDVQTAAILTSADLTQIHSIGINGGPKNGQQCLCQIGDGKAKYSCVHAEQNCLVKNSIITDSKKILICTKQPCAMCASLIVNSDTNIIEVWFLDEYWDWTGVEILLLAGIIVKKIIERGTEYDIERV